MKKAVLIPDSFKGTLSSREICEILTQKIQERFPLCQTVSIPVADGGEGSVDCFLTALGGEKVTVQVAGPHFEPIKAGFGVLPDGETAVVEMAACAGLPLVEGQKDPLGTTTYGVGQLFLAAVHRGCRNIIVCLGGSCTNDGGAGAAAAVGIRFFDRQGKSFVPTGGTLCQVARIDPAGKSPALEGVSFVTMCDIDNPLFGPAGAAFVFGPQKGADDRAVRLLDQGLAAFSKVIWRDLGRAVDQLPGGGAAGGMGAGMAAFFDSPLKSGIETVLDTVGFDEVITGADVIFTGEGKLDAQSLRGKVISGVAKRAKAQRIPVIALVGDAESGVDEIYAIGVTAVFPINRKALSFPEIRPYSREYLGLTAENVLRLLERF